MTSLSVVMIARNEERCMARALASVADHVDEIVVVDTGSTDGTVDIARSWGARTGHFAWRDDFAAAKNHALDMATGEVRLVLDADEWVTDGAAALRDWAARHRSDHGLVRCVSAFDAGPQVQRQADLQTRVLPAHARYEGTVHEQVVGAERAVASPVVIEHDGYRDEQLRAKAGRNEALLRAALERDSRDGYLWYQLGVCLATYGRHAEAVDAFARAHSFLDDPSPQGHPLAVRHLYSLGKTRRFEDASRHYRRSLDRWADSPDLHFVMADVLLDLGVQRPAQAAAVIPLIRSLLQRCLVLGERPELPGSVAGRGSGAARRNLALLPIRGPGGVAHGVGLDEEPTS